MEIFSIGLLMLEESTLRPNHTSYRKFISMNLLQIFDNIVSFGLSFFLTSEVIEALRGQKPSNKHEVDFLKKEIIKRGLTT